MTRARTPADKRRYQTHGVTALAKALSRQGLRALDGRSALARHVRDFCAGVVADRGGQDALSTGQHKLVEVVGQDVALLAVADAYLSQQGAQVIDKRHRRFIALVEQRQRIASHLVDVLGKIGLDRRARPVIGASALMAALSAAPTPAPVESTPTPAPEASDGAASVGCGASSEVDTA
jgi:hypothetical protein